MLRAVNTAPESAAAMRSPYMVEQLQRPADNMDQESAADIAGKQIIYLFTEVQLQQSAENTEQESAAAPAAIQVILVPAMNVMLKLEKSI